MDIKDTDIIGYADLIKIIFGDKCIEEFLVGRECDYTFAEVMQTAKENGYDESGIITLIAESPLAGKVFQYGNYGKYWVEHGGTIGYA
ncbi:hypothetical protein [Kineothrix sp. MB12-C1]|uniref:hypothetical protein n=1 Tax=Kineothrix sp. MB12-C1 TaxID=3070215 RepID=UPI0027D30A11|nr:hypothetical protein [Kineothrix sp. MB12-C1]WMC91245.1 hypothetical protein RBB56_10145 [Kineothrix sp. MB12-C1]